MANRIDIELLCGEVQEFLDTDCRFWDEDEGCFDYWGEKIMFRRLPDHFVIEIVSEGLEVICCRT